MDRKEMGNITERDRKEFVNKSTEEIVKRM